MTESIPPVYTYDNGGAGYNPAVLPPDPTAREDEAMRGVHRSHVLAAPVTDPFGTYNTRWDYTVGCVPGTELGSPEVGSLQVRLAPEPDGTRKLIHIGRTPARHDPNEGGRAIELEGQNVGAPAPYLLVTRTVRPDGTTVKERYRYVTDEDLNVRLAHGDRFELAPNYTLGRHITSPGVIEQVSAFVYR